VTLRMRIACVLAAMTCAALSGCGPDMDIIEDRCMYRQVFRECMAALPAGPVRTHYNDWGEVVESCDTAAHQQSWRARRNVPQECR
jgi:hypothetical protein